MSEKKYCPIMILNAQNASPVCPKKLCEWYCEFADSCSIPLLAGMFADSTICQNTFES